MKIFLDSSDINAIEEFEPKVDGFTTNPTLMRKAGVTDYEKFCKEVLTVVNGKPVSFEVFADEFDEMERQARIISSWGENVYVKIPITNTKGESSISLINKLRGIFLNITAVLPDTQVRELIVKATPEPGSIISIFCGRIADTGRNPKEWIEFARKVIPRNYLSILWASPREVLNIYQAEKAGADIITVTPELLTKYWEMKDKDLNELSLDTVKMFYNDAEEAGYTL